MSSGIPYLGSKISLISKSEIRYEGILYTIDTKESTIALAKVRSFGTEDRPTDRPVVPRNEVYEYIIFRASDIKDLHVCEAPKHQQTLASGLPNDPAIVEHSAPVSTSAGFPSSTFRPPSGYGPVGALPFQYNAQQSSSTSSLPRLSQSFVGSRSGTPTPTPQQRKSPTMDAGVQVSAEQPSSPEGKDRKPAAKTQQQQQQQQQQPTPAGQQRRQPSSRQQQQARQGAAQQQQQPVQQQQFQPQRTRQARRGRGQRGRQTASNRPKEILQFDGEFDFEQANAEFQEIQSKLVKMKIDDLTPPVDEKKDDSGNETQAGEGHEEEETYFYDKSKSFFDNISCEALARSKGNFERLDWRQERKLNVETFGVSARSNWRRNAWRGRGFRGRGAFRGSRGVSRGRGGSSGQRTGNPIQQQQQQKDTVAAPPTTG